MAKCAGCGKFLSPTGAATCNTCTLMYHKACVAIPDTKNVPKFWSCPECKKNIPKGDNSATPIKDACANNSPPSPISESVDSFISPTTEEYGMQAIRREMAEYMREIRECRKEMVELRFCITGFGQRLDGIEQRLDTLEKREEATKSKDVEELEHTISQLKLELNERDQEALLSDLDIGCLPEEKGENVYHTVTVLGIKLGIKIEEKDIVFAERVGPRSKSSVGESEDGKKIRRIIVRFSRRHLRDELLHAARVRRNLNTTDMGLNGPSRRIYINERLTHVNRKLFYIAREESRKQNWKYVWTKRGRIFARQADSKQAFSIRCENDIFRVFEIDKVHTLLNKK